MSPAYPLIDALQGYPKILAKVLTYVSAKFKVNAIIFDVFFHRLLALVSFPLFAGFGCRNNLAGFTRRIH
jgi:hypothetical protein